MSESAVVSLERPSRRTLEALREKFSKRGPHDGRGFELLGGNSRSIYTDMEDLIALKKFQHQDRLTTFVQDYLAIFFQVSVSKS